MVSRRMAPKETGFVTREGFWNGNLVNELLLRPKKNYFPKLLEKKKREDFRWEGDERGS